MIDNTLGGWREHTVTQLNGDGTRIKLPARFQIITESLRRVVAVPYVIYMPEKNRLLLLVNCDYGPNLKPTHYGMLMTSDNDGGTWTQPEPIHVDAEGNRDVGMTCGLTYFGGGNVCLYDNDNALHWFSSDFGETWNNSAPGPAYPSGKCWYEWDPLFIDRDAESGQIQRLMAYSATDVAPGHFQGYVSYSTDEGRSWSAPIAPPEFNTTNEVAFLRARNGDIVAACRTDNPERFLNEIDHYSGLGVSISTDNAQTWSALDMLYEYGRHHPSLVLMPNGDLVMTYIVRVGYLDAADGFIQFGIEAIVGHDNGRSWDLDHKYILAAWKSNRQGETAWYASCQSTSTVLLPDGSLLTVFGTGYRNEIAPDGLPIPRDIGAVRWRLHETGQSSPGTEIGSAPFDSELRNVCNPGDAVMELKAR